MQLSAEGISFRYQQRSMLFKEINFSIKQGEFVGLTGPSGCGKSTFCRILAGYESPTEGAIRLNGLPIKRNGYYPIQLVFQHPEKAVNPRWKIEKTLNEGWKVDKEILELLGIEKGWLTRWPNELSGGELQRICIARALSPRTQFLIADEMTTMLDAITQAQIWQAVRTVAKNRRMGIIVVSHEEHLVERLCERVVRLDEVGIK